MAKNESQYALYFHLDLRIGKARWNTICSHGSEIEKMRQAIICGMQAINGAVYNLFPSLQRNNKHRQKSMIEPSILSYAWTSLLWCVCVCERERGQSHETASRYAHWSLRRHLIDWQWLEYPSIGRALRFLHLDSPEMVSTASGLRSHLDL